MTLSKDARPPCRPTGIQVFWEFTKEAVATEFRSTLRLLAAPLRALWTGSADPIRTAVRNAEEDSNRVVDRYVRRARSRRDALM
jgi:hypothetical protein